TDRQTNTSTNQVVGATFATISVPEGGSMTVPWMPGQIYQFTVSVGSFGLADALGIVAQDQKFFAFTFSPRNGGPKFLAFGGTPTTTAQFPKVGIGAQQLTNLSNPGNGTPNLVFAPNAVASDAQLKGAAVSSPLYSVYTQNLNGVPYGGAVPDAMQVTISIA